MYVSLEPLFGCLYACLCLCMCLCLYVCACPSVHVSVPVCLYLSLCACVCVCMSVPVPLCMCPVCVPVLCLKEQKGFTIFSDHSWSLHKQQPGACAVSIAQLICPCLICADGVNYCMSKAVLLTDIGRGMPQWFLFLKRL